MLAKVEVSTWMYTFYFFETKRHKEFDICSGISVVSQLIMVVETIMIITETKCFMPFQTHFFPFWEPLQFCTRFYKELHLHLFKFTHTENELTGHNLITESLTNLCNTKRYFHTPGFLYIEVVHENSLCCFRTKVYFHCTFRSRSHISREHQVELTNLCPVLSTGNRTNDFFINNDLTEFVKITIV